MGLGVKLEIAIHTVLTSPMKDEFLAEIDWLTVGAEVCSNLTIPLIVLAEFINIDKLPPVAPVTTESLVLSDVPNTDPLLKLMLMDLALDVESKGKEVEDVVIVE